MSEYRIWGLILLTLCFPIFADDEDLFVEKVETVSVRVTESDTPESIAAQMVGLEEKLEISAPETQGFWRRRWEAAKAKYNFVHRIRVGRREVNASGGKVKEIPVSMIMFNGAAALIGIHIAESTVIGPSFIWLGGQLAEAAPVIARGLQLWGGALINPFPTYIPPIDAVTETFCWITLLIVKTDAYHRGVYWIEMKLLKIGGALARLVGLHHVWNALMEKQNGVERLIEAFEDSGHRRVKFNAKDLHFYIRDPNGKKLARLKLDITEKKEVKLVSFERYPHADTKEGRGDLAFRLGTFGTDIRDAVLNPKQLIAGGHGMLMGENQYEVVGNSVLLRSRWVVKRSICEVFTRMDE